MAITFRMSAPDGDIGNVTSENIHDALNSGFKLQTEATTGDKVQSFTQGVSGAIGGIADFAVGGLAKLGAHLGKNGPVMPGHEERYNRELQKWDDFGNKMWTDKPIENFQRQGVGAIAGAIGSGVGHISSATGLAEQGAGERFGKSAKEFITEDTGLEHLKEIKIARTAGDFAGMALMPSGLIEKGIANLTKFSKAEKVIQKAGAFATTTEASNFIKNGVMVENATGQLIKPRFAQQVDKLLKNFLTDAIVGGSFEAIKSDEPDANAFQTTVLPIFASIMVGSAIPIASAKAVENITKYVSDASKGITSTERKLIKEFTGKIDITKADELKKSGLPVSVDLMTDDGQIKSLVHNEIAKSKISSEIFDKAQEGINEQILKKISSSSDHLGKEITATADKTKSSIATDKAYNIVSNRLDQLDTISKEYYDKMKNIQYSFQLPEANKYVNELLAKKGIDRKSFIKLFKDDEAQIENLLAGGKNYTPESILEFRNVLNNAFNRSDTAGKTEILNKLSRQIDKDIIKIGDNTTQQEAKQFANLWLVARSNYKHHKKTVLQTELAKGIIKNKLPEDLIKHFADPTKTNRLNELDTIFLSTNVTNKSKQLANVVKKSIFEVYLEKNILKNIENNKLTNVYTSLRNDKTYLTKLLGIEKYNKLEQEIIPYLGTKIQSASINKNPSGSALVAMNEDKLTSNFTKYGATAGGLLGAQAGGTIGAGVGSFVGAGVGKYIDKKIINKKIRETKEIAGLLFDTEFNDKLIQASKDIKSKPVISTKNMFLNTAKNNISPFINQTIRNNNR